jgi:hypothetical protein
MNILILTAFTKNVVWNNYGNCDFGKFTSEINLKYANKNNYSFVCEILQEPLVDRQNSWIKIPLIQKYLSQYDYVVWIDADAIFLKNIKIEEFIEDGIDLILSKNALSENKIMYTITSTGFMVWKNSKWSIDTLNQLWENYNLYAYSHFHEQTALDQLLLPKLTSQNLINKELSDLENSLIQENVKIIPYSYHNLSYDTLFIYHAGGDTPTKFKRLVDVYEKYNNNKLKILFQYGSFLCMWFYNTGEYSVEILGVKENEEFLLQKYDSIYFLNDRPDRSIYFVVNNLCNYAYYKVKVYNNKENFSCYKKFKFA